ncbi:hypothetical protein TWF481_005501 [Arthrobotrys musiformis]|uniref:Uncharacterized protein n=1 Tax=Arthrobotrys musiformis TaxID=47236 RepID=A0AAV9WDW7_9PEZI
MKSSIFLLTAVTNAILVAAQADPATWAKYDHCPTTPTAGCAYICISSGIDPFCAANDPLTPRVYCSACPTTGDACPAIFDASCSYLCADASDPNVRRCAGELPDGAQNVFCAGCAGAPGTSTATVTATVTTISTLIRQHVSIVVSKDVSTVVSKEVSTSTVTTVISGAADTSSPVISGYETTALPVPPVLPSYNPPGNGTSGNGTLTTGLPSPTYISGGSRMVMGGSAVAVGVLGVLGLVSVWYMAAEL